MSALPIAAPDPRDTVGPAPRRWVLPVAVAGATVAATVLVAMRSPYAPGSYGVCPSIALFGVWCPACGGLRAAHELATGDVLTAFAMNPAVVLGAPVVAVLWLLWLLGRTGRRPPLRLSVRTAWVTLGALLVFGVLRNVPLLLPLLAPGGVPAPSFVLG